MNTLIMFVSLMNVVQPSHRPGHEIRVVSLAMQSDERAGKPCSGSSTVIVYENAADMRGGK
jgi:hypothetical protein